MSQKYEKYIHSFSVKNYKVPQLVFSWSSKETFGTNSSRIFKHDFQVFMRDEEREVAIQMEIQRKRENWLHSQRDGDRERSGDTVREIEKEREVATQLERQRQREKWRHSQRDRDKERSGDTIREIETEREVATQLERQRKREKWQHSQRDRENGIQKVRYL